MFLLRLVWAVVHALFAKRADLVAENLALRQQLIVLRRKTRRPRLKTKDRVFWLWLARSWDGWRESLIVVKPATVVRWHRQGFKYYWAWKSRHKGGRPAAAPEVRDLIRRMSRANPLWGAPRIHGELLKLGIDLSQATVAKYMAPHSKPSSPGWRSAPPILPTGGLTIRETRLCIGDGGLRPIADVIAYRARCVISIADSLLRYRVEHSPRTPPAGTTGRADGALGMDRYPTLSYIAFNRVLWRRIWSIKPYSRASSAVMMKSRSVSWSIRSGSCPVWLTRISFTNARRRRISRA